MAARHGEIKGRKKTDLCLLGNPIRRKKKKEQDGGGERQPSLTSLVPEPHVFHAGCNELVR